MRRKVNKIRKAVQVLSLSTAVLLSTTGFAGVNYVKAENIGATGSDAVISGAELGDDTDSDSSNLNSSNSNTDTPANTNPGANSGENGSTENENILSEFAAGKDTDIILSGVNAPAAKYNSGTTVGFTAAAKGEGAYIISIAPVVAADFPFETNDAAYNIVTPNGDERPAALNASYNFTVRSDVTTGYHSVQFQIEYHKDKTDYYIVKTINVKLEGEPEPTEATTEAPIQTGPISTPRVIVTGFETTPAKILAGENFTLTLHLQNTSDKTAVSNMKVSLSANEGDFLPTSGSSTMFVNKLGKEETTDLVIEMNALASLEPKPHVLTVACDYEDSSANPFQSSENISIPIYQESRIKITDVSVSPETISVYNQGSVSFNINNLGKSTIANVQARIEGDTVECEESFVGNIAAGATGYGDVTVTGMSPTMDDGTVKLILSYEDSTGEVNTFEQDINLFIMEEYIDDGFYIDDPSYYDDPGMQPESPLKKVVTIALIALVAVIVIIVVIVIAVKSSKKKKARLEAEELENEIDDDLLSGSFKEK